MIGVIYWMCTFFNQFKWQPNYWTGIYTIWTITDRYQLINIQLVNVNILLVFYHILAYYMYNNFGT